MVSISLVPALALLYFYVSTFRSTCAVPNMAVFCSSFTSWFPGMLLMYFLNDFEMVPVAPIITDIALVYYYYYYYYYHYHHHHYHYQHPCPFHMTVCHNIRAQLKASVIGCLFLKQGKC